MLWLPSKTILRQSEMNQKIRKAFLAGGAGHFAHIKDLWEMAMELAGMKLTPEFVNGELLRILKQ